MPQGFISRVSFPTTRNGLIEEVTEEGESVANMKAVEHDARDGREGGGIEGWLLEELDKRTESARSGH